MAGASALLLALLVIIWPWYPLQLLAGLGLIAFLPGYALLSALWPRSADSSLSNSERWLLAVPLSCSLTIVISLLIVFTHAPLNIFVMVGSLAGITILFNLLAGQRRLGATYNIPTLQSPISNLQALDFWLILILLLAALFRIVNIHYSDYQGDEADILLRAVSLVYGHTEAILTHSKGPGEILLLNAIGALTGRFDEQTARLPFALAGTISVGLLVLLGQALFKRPVGLLAGLLAALDGVFVSYARTAQYQSVVLLLTLGTIFCFFRFYQSNGQSRRWHGLGAFLLAAAFLFHFEALFLLPLVLFLTLAPLARQAKVEAISSRFTFYTARALSVPLASLWGVLRLWPSLLIFILPVAAFYVPFLLNPNVNSTGAYLENRVSGGSLPPFNNLSHFFYFEALKYNSAYFVALFDALLLAVLIGTLAGVHALRAFGGSRGEGGRKANFSPVLLLIRLLAAMMILCGAVLAWMELSQSAAWLLAGGFGLFLALVILWPQTPLPQRLLWLWLAPSFWVYALLVNRPGKHHYLFLGALTLWVAWAAWQGWHWIDRRWPVLNRPAGRWAAIIFGLALMVLCRTRHHAFWRSDLEYILTYPDYRSSLYPTGRDFPYGTRIGFGYPFRLGWQLVGQMRRTGQLQGDWAGNDDGNAPRWYMLGQAPTPCYPRYVLRGEVTYKGDPDFDVPFDPVSFGYRPRYRLWGNDRLRLTILEFNPTDQPEVVDLTEPPRFEPPVTAADFAAVMSLPEGTTPPPQVRLDPALVLGEGSELKNNAPPAYVERAQQLTGRVALLGYDVDMPHAHPGDILPITLYWQAQSLLSLRYKVFIHLLSAEGNVVAQADDFPACGTSHANSWSSGVVILDRHLLKLAPDLPPGDYTFLVGMYEPDLNLRLNYFDVAGNEQGNSLNVGALKIKG
ncbi:MAG: DUF1616 domain-containing protein [Anaerolineae bacterium]